MTYLIKIEWLGGQESRQRSEHEGRYVSRYDPDAHDGMGEVWTTVDLRAAMHFNSRAEAVEFWRQASKVKPVRGDGRPNRPLTAFTVSIFDWERREGYARR